MIDSIGRDELIKILERIDEKLDRPQKLCFIGGAALMLMGHPGRQTVDIDVWRRESQLVDSLLRKAVEAAGISFDVKEDTPSGVYMQIVTPGIVNLPVKDGEKWPGGDESRTLWQGIHLTVFSPPPQILAAAKLIRATEVDLEDIAYLMATGNVDQKSVGEALRHFPNPADREIAKDNVELLNVFVQKGQPSRTRKGHEEDGR